MPPRLIPILLLMVLLLALAAWWGHRALSASLPLVDGEHVLPGLTAPLTVNRDALGIPTIRGATRVDVARATGFVHAQDRFFQMDLSRRRAAGELAALVGASAVDVDRAIRIHRFRAVARRSVDLLRLGDRAVLDAYTDGVNAGLAALDAPPFEYTLLRQAPAAWRPEDTMLVVLSMFATLQDEDGSFEAMRATMRRHLPPEAFAFFAPEGTPWDSPVAGDPFPSPPPPSAEVFNPRLRRQGMPTRLFPNSGRARLAPAGGTPADTALAHELSGAGGLDQGEAAIGSNNFAVAGSLTASGGALVANDMHLVIRVPNIWYRAAFEWQDGNGAEPERLYGVTLPGVPSMVVGSNAHVAWGFTNAYGDWSDLVELELDPADPGRYRTPHGFVPFERHDEAIAIAGAPSQVQRVDWTIWGPVLGPDPAGRLRAIQWLAHDPAMLASTLMPIEEARTIEEAFDGANGAGTPAQNLLVADRGGRIGWTIYGSLPRRVGFDGALPADRSDGTRRWDGYLDEAAYPRLTDPSDGRLWTANARVVDRPMVDVMGTANHEVGSRARVIRDRLRARDRFTPSDLLAIQLDASATFLEGWRALLLDVLSAPAARHDPSRAALRDLLDRGWTGEADPSSAAYRFTRLFRERVSQWAFGFLLADCYEADERFDYSRERRREGPLWQLVTLRPLHLLDPHFRSWDEFLLEAIDRVLADTVAEYGPDLTARTWMEMNDTRYRHPLSAAVPLLGRWLDMPPAPVPGDLFTPRVAWGSLAASQRMVVSPGREHEGIMHMPTGQSGHPLSPHYRDGHGAWVQGAPTPFLPGPAEHSLTLVPR
ncbi:MAG: penicillin acylase family protein [Acidimicrobiia bacterium]|nr:penicillin acylase family protein [Acidimicrobiia bacterium]